MHVHGPQHRNRSRGRTVLVASAAVWLALGCMFEPGNETALRSRGQSVSFSGVAITPRATVTIEAAASPAGPFSVIATVQASGLPTLLSAGARAQRG